MHANTVDMMPPCGVDATATPVAPGGLGNIASLPRARPVPAAGEGGTAPAPVAGPPEEREAP
jgi:hypothetical protein